MMGNGGALIGRVGRIQQHKDIGEVLLNWFGLSCYGGWGHDCCIHDPGSSRWAHFIRQWRKECQNRATQIQNASVDELPEYLSSKFVGERTAAKERLEQLRGTDP